MDQFSFESRFLEIEEGQAHGYGRDNERIVKLAHPVKNEEELNFGDAW
jgi:hypothetical protein